MLAKPENLQALLARKRFSLYFLTGGEVVLQEESERAIRAAHEASESNTCIHMDIAGAADWEQLANEACSYSLFAETTLICARFEKKTFDSAAIAFFEGWLENPNPRTTLLMRMPAVGVKTLQRFVSHPQALVIQAQTPDAAGLRRYLTAALSHMKLTASAELVSLIVHNTANNLLACRQLLDKLALTTTPGSTLTDEDILELLEDVSVFPLYELADACIAGNATKALHVLRRARELREEPLLVLWYLLQEIRNLLQLSTRLPSTSVESAAAGLKIWPKRVPLYKNALRRMQEPLLLRLLHTAGTLDAYCKSNASYPVWESLERIALVLCGKMAL